MGKPKRNISLYIRAVGVVLSGLLFAFELVANFAPLPRVSWQFAELASSAVFIGFIVWHFIALHNQIRRLETRLSGITNPILRIREYGNERKDMKTPHANSEGVGFQTKKYATLFIDVFNKQTRGTAERVWSTVQWLGKDGAVVLSHRGRWHIATATINNEKTKENLQYRDLDSNQAVQRLYFAWADREAQDGHIYGLERNMDGNDSWDSRKHQLSDQQYRVRITLRGNDGVRQEFEYGVKSGNGKIAITKALTPESERDVS